jgi:putative membrane protein
VIYRFFGRDRGEKMKDKEILILVGVVLLLLVAFGGGMMGVGMGIGLLFWVGVFVLVYYLITDKKTAKNQNSALEILDKRYASGEISREEYLEMKKEIMET